MKKTKAKRICEDCGEKKEGDFYLVLGSKRGETIEVFLCNKCVKQYGGTVQRRKKHD